MKARLEILRDTKHLEWGELAQALGISRSMLDHVRSGFRSFGPKTIRRLEQLEVDAGIKTAHRVAEEPGTYMTRNVAEEMRRELREMKKDLATMDKRVDAMLDQLGKERIGR